MGKFQPVIKWTGSKRTQSKEIVNHFPREIDTYYEPFLGGGSVMYRLLKSDIKINKLICSDINEDLINLWSMIKNNPSKLSLGYEKLWYELNNDDDLDRKKQYFNHVRQRYNDQRNPIDFLFISRTCVNGKIRYNKKGEFNNSFHVTRNGIIPKSLDKIIKDWSCLINDNDVTFVHQDYTSINTDEDDYMYLDPPYAGTTDMYYGGIDLDSFYRWLSEQKCNYVLSFDGMSGNDNYITKIPSSLYDIHRFIDNGNSTFKKVDKGKNEMVRESLYIKNKRSFDMEFTYKENINQLEVGVIIAELTNSNKTLTLETNGEHDDIYLEVVEYVDGIERSFSDPIYEPPKNKNEAIELIKSYMQ